MDCRKSLLLTMCLPFAASGCLFLQTTNTTTTTPPTGVTPPPIPPPSMIPAPVVSQAKPSGPPHKPHAETYVAMAKAQVGRADGETGWFRATARI